MTTAATETSATSTATETATATADATTSTTGSESASEQISGTATATKTDIPPEVAAALKKANKEAETYRLKLKEFEDRDKTDAQKLQEERDALKTERDALASENLRRDVAEKKGIDPKLAKFLTGSTREELEAAADELAAVVKTTKPAFGDIGQGSRGQAVGRIYTKAELNNHAFFLENKADILQAAQEGRITD